MIKDGQVKSFNEKGYLVIENLLPENILKNLQKVTDDFVEKSRTIKKFPFETSCTTDCRRIGAPPISKSPIRSRKTFFPVLER